MEAPLTVSTRSRRLYGATFKRQPAANWHEGLRAALAELYSTAPVTADEAAQIDRACSEVPYRKRQGDLPLVLPERPSE